MTVHHEHDAHEDVYFEGSTDAHCSAGSDVPVEPVLQSWELQAALGVLTARQRYVVECSWGLRDGVHYSFRDIAEAMGVHHSTAHEHYSAAMKRLRSAALHNPDALVFE